MAAKKSSAGMDLILAYLRNDKTATYQEVATAAAKKKLKIYPIMYGRAQAMLGIVKQARRGQGKAAKRKAAKKKAAKAAGTRRGPGRPRKTAAAAVDGSLESIVAAVKNSEQERARYRSALERIQKVLGDALE